METTEIVAFYQVLLHLSRAFNLTALYALVFYFVQSSGEELYYLFEHFYDHFHATSGNSLHANFISSHSNNIHALDQLLILKNKPSSFSQVFLS